MEHCRACEILPITRLRKDLGHQEGPTCWSKQTSFHSCGQQGFLFAISPQYGGCLTWGLWDCLGLVMLWAGAYKRELGPAFVLQGLRRGFPQLQKDTVWHLSAWSTPWKPVCWLDSMVSWASFTVSIAFLKTCSSSLQPCRCSHPLNNVNKYIFRKSI